MFCTPSRENRTIKNEKQWNNLKKKQWNNLTSADDTINESVEEKLRLGKKIIRVKNKAFMTLSLM